MAKVTRENILEEYKKAIARRKELEGKSYKITVSKPSFFLGGMTINNLSIDLIKGVYVNVKEFFGDDEMNKVLGIKSTKEDRLCGYTKDEWIESLKTRVAQIQDKEELIVLNKQISLYEKNLSKDDKFALDMEAAENASVD